MKILFIAIQGIGNTLMAVPTFKLLREKYRNSEIDLLTMNSVKNLLKTCPYLDNIYVIDKNIQKNFSRKLFLIGKLRKKKYDVCITTFPAAQSHFNILSALIGSRKRITSDYRKNLVWLQNERVPIKILHDVEQNLNLLSPLKIKNVKKASLELWPTKEEERFAEKFVKKFKEKIFVGIHPGTSVGRKMAEKRWPIENFAELIDKLIESKGARVFVFLGPEDKPLEKIKEMVKIKNRSRLTIVKDLDIRKSSTIIGKCKFFISNDSGLMHIAVAMKVPTAGVFTSTDYRRTSPYGKNNLIIKNGETYKIFRQSLEELSGIKTNWKNKKVDQVSVKDVMGEIKGKLK